MPATLACRSRCLLAAPWSPRRPVERTRARLSLETKCYEDRRVTARPSSTGQRLSSHVSPKRGQAKTSVGCNRFTGDTIDRAPSHGDPLAAPGSPKRLLVDHRRRRGRSDGSTDEISGSLVLHTSLCLGSRVMLRCSRSSTRALSTPARRDAGLAPLLTLEPHPREPASSLDDDRFEQTGADPRSLLWKQIDVRP
jgi:hypothetical protein